jgi:hypothetical protein
VNLWNNSIGNSWIDKLVAENVHVPALNNTEWNRLKELLKFKDNKNMINTIGIVIELPIIK